MSRSGASPSFGAAAALEVARTVSERHPGVVDDDHGLSPRADHRNSPPPESSRVPFGSPERKLHFQDGCCHASISQRGAVPSTSWGLKLFARRSGRWTTTQKPARGAQETLTSPGKRNPCGPERNRRRGPGSENAPEKMRRFTCRREPALHPEVAVAPELLVGYAVDLRARGDDGR